MDRIKIAKELLCLAKSLTAMEFDTKAELEAYLKKHPKADRAKHRVKEQKPEGKKPAPEKKEAPVDKKKKQEDYTKNVDKEFNKAFSPHKKTSIKKDSLSKVKNILKANGLTEDSDEMKEMAGFKKELGQQVPQKDFGKYQVRNVAQLKEAFLKNMNPSNYDSPKAFKAAKERIQKMTNLDFGKTLAAVMADDEEKTASIRIAKELVMTAKSFLALSKFDLTNDFMDIAKDSLMGGLGVAFNVKPVYESFLTFTEGNSNKFHYFAVFPTEKPGNYVGGNAYGRIGQMPKSIKIAEGDKYSVTNAVQVKERQKRNKGYE